LDYRVVRPCYNEWLPGIFSHSSLYITVQLIKKSKQFVRCFHGEGMYTLL
jgi:hypothetical protein